MTQTIHFRIKETDYRKASALCDALGVTVQDALQLFTQQAIQARSLPFGEHPMHPDTVRLVLEDLALKDNT